MQFTMGTLTALFTIALMGTSIAWMFNDYENTALENKFPFDVQVYSSDVREDFADEIRLIEDNTKLRDIYLYHIYTDRSDQANTWMLTHLHTWGAIFQKEDGSPDMQKIRDFLKGGGVYCTYDTYMQITDYNYLRQMLGYEKVNLRPDEYLVQIKSRLRGEVRDISQDLKIADASGTGYLSCKGIYSEPFSQDGHNGGDYIIVVPDEMAGQMQPYYSEMTADIEGKAPADLEQKLEALEEEGEQKNFEYWTATPEGNNCYGSDNIMSYPSDYLVRDNLIPEVKYMLASLILPMFYIGLIFVCVSVTVLSVQQLSDSVKYKFRYDVLAKLGVDRLQIHHLIRKQLMAYYLCPALLAIIISGKMILFMSRRFVEETGVPVPFGSFFIKSIALFFGIYLVYFAVTYIGFKRNLEGR